MLSTIRTTPTRHRSWATHPTSHFIAALILPSADQTGALAVLDHAGELILRAPLPGDPVHDARDREGLLAHLTHFVPNLAAVTDVFVSRLPNVAWAPAPGRQTPESPFCPASGRLLRFLAWLGPVPHLVAPATWLTHHGVPPGSTETLRQTCIRCLPELLLSDLGPHATDDVRAAVLLVHYIRVGMLPGMYKTYLATSAELKF